MEADPGLRTLLELQRQPHWKAQDGSPGGSSNKFGADGSDFIIRVPLGTVVREILADGSERFVADLTEPGQRIVAARGGAGGRGNASFKSGKNRAPRIAELGEPAAEATLELELKLLADVGLVGFPNAGKSTLLSVVSQAKPKIADYPFTTLSPNLGVVNWRGRNFIMADIPGLIEGASKGRGLGLDFLRHIERTRVLVHILDVWGFGNGTAAENYKATCAELKAYSSELASRPQILALNKMDLPGAKAKAAEFRRASRVKKVFEISCVKRQGLEKVLAEIARHVKKAALRVGKGREESAAQHPEVIRVEQPFGILREDNGWRVSGATVEKWTAMTRMGEWQAVERLQLRLRRSGVEKALRRAGCKPGDVVRIGGHEFEFQE